MAYSRRNASGNGQRPEQQHDDGRRDFLKKAGTLPVALAAGASASSVAGAQTDRSALPQIKLGPHSISRLICGNNCFGGGSHLSCFVNYEMRAYYTTEQILKTLRRCEQVGINCWQSGLGNIEMYRDFVDQGLKMHYIAIAAGDPSGIQKLKDGGCIAIAHHGEVTDRLFKSGKIDDMHDYLKRVRDAGLQVGVSTHMPAVVDTIESKDWDLDYYMTCVYERHRTRDELKELMGYTPIPEREVYLEEDPPRMFKAMQQTDRPCLAFKFLAAGRLSDRRHWVEQAFRQTYESIKSIDAAIVGIYDRYSDQPAENAAMVRRFGNIVAT